MCRYVVTRNYRTAFVAASTPTLVQFWQINRDGSPVAYFYLDPYSRPHEKRQVLFRERKFDGSCFSSLQLIRAQGCVDGLRRRPQPRVRDSRAGHCGRRAAACCAHGVQRFAPC